jgi:serine/threonine protein kinase
MADHYNHGMEEVLAKRLFRQVAEALNFMHSKRCVHLDIKLENILLIKDEDKQLVAKLGYFEDVMHFESNQKNECSDSEFGTKTSGARSTKSQSYSHTVQWLPISIVSE